MRSQVNVTIDRSALGKGVFQPSRAAIAREMECRIRLGSSPSREQRASATGSRH